MLSRTAPILRSISKRTFTTSAINMGVTVERIAPGMFGPFRRDLRQLGQLADRSSTYVPQLI
jgi:hypothetical protein